jgi:uncharacterized membrane protein
MLVTGIFWGPWFSLHRKLYVFSKSEFIHIVKTIAANLAVPMRILMPLCILLMLLSVLFHPQKESWEFYLTLIAFCLTVTSLVITLVVEVPIVTMITQWTEATIPDNWESLRDRWIKFHVLRTFSSMVSFMCLSASIVF